MLECNYLSILPSYEKPIDNGQDVLDRGLTTLSIPGMESTVERMKNSPYYLVKALNEKTIVPKVIFLQNLKIYILIILI